MGVYAAKSNDGLKRVKQAQNEVKAIFQLANGRNRKVEFNSTTGYLSQSTSTFVLNNNIKKVFFQDINGKTIREVSN
jgi:hypothetical protein